jgi:hypothetical protein
MLVGLRANMASLTSPRWNGVGPVPDPALPQSTRHCPTLPRGRDQKFGHSPMVRSTSQNRFVVTMGTQILTSCGTAWRLSVVVLPADSLRT